MGAPRGTVGLVGLGMMGFPMAHRLHEAGCRLVVHDAASAACERFTREHPGSAAAGSIAGLRDAGVVITMLPSSDVVDAVVLGDGASPGLAVVLARGAVVVDMSSSQPLRSRALAATLAAAGIGFLDAPVSGGVKRAIDGSLAIMVGGDEALFETQRPLLAIMGHSITRVGDAGAGHAVKALNNYVSAAGLVAACEAMLAARAFGVDPAVAVDVFNASTGRNNTTENKAKQFMLSGRFDSGFSLRLMAKDLGIATGLGESIGSPMPLGGHVLALWREAARSLAASADHTEMFRFLQESARRDAR